MTFHAIVQQAKQSTDTKVQQLYNEYIDTLNSEFDTYWRADSLLLQMRAELARLNGWASVLSR